MRMLSRKSLVVAAALMAMPLSHPFTATPAFAQLVNLPSFAPLVKEVGPAVVTVVVSGETGGPSAGEMREFEEFMERFRDFMPNLPDIAPNQRGPRGERRAQGMGSGFIVDADGIIVTNNHVVENANEITVVMDDGTELEAELIGRDTKIDIAVLKVDAARDLPTVEWGASENLEVGDWALAIGNPLGLDGTVTAGIISSLGRDINSGPYDAYIQVDAAINRGNSGGPLFDVNGKVIGVNTAIISPSGGNVGLGFAIPASQAIEIVEDLLDDGVVERGWIGVAIQSVTEDVAESLGLSAAGGALVADVTPDSPADAAGLRAGDVILSFGDTAINDLRDLTNSVARWDVGVDAPMLIWRDGAEQEIGIVPAMMETASLDVRGQSAPADEVMPAMTDVPELGFELRSDGGEVVIADVSSGEAAADSGLEQGDVIIAMNQTTIDDPAHVTKMVADAIEADRKNVLLLIERDGERRFVTLELSSA